MGKLIDGKWTVGSIITSSNSGAYQRLPRTFLETILKEHKTFKPESNRFINKVLKRVEEFLI